VTPCGSSTSPGRHRAGASRSPPLPRSTALGRGRGRHHCLPRAASTTTSAAATAIGEPPTAPAGPRSPASPVATTATAAVANADQLGRRRARAELVPLAAVDLGAAMACVRTELAPLAVTSARAGAARSSDRRPAGRCVARGPSWMLWWWRDARASRAWRRARSSWTLRWCNRAGRAGRRAPGRAGCCGGRRNVRAELDACRGGARTGRAWRRARSSPALRWWRSHRPSLGCRRLAPALTAAAEVECQGRRLAPVLAATATAEVERQVGELAPALAAAAEDEHQVGELAPRSSQKSRQVGALMPVIAAAGSRHVVLEHVTP
jgi:hypothetical protein